MSAAKYDAIVIGAGSNGLTAAAVLAKAGRRTLVLESADAVGGHRRPIEFAPGFRAVLDDDCGWVPPAVSRALGLKEPEVMTRSRLMGVARDGGDVVFLRGESGMPAVLREHAPNDVDAWPALVRRLNAFARVLADLYQLAPPDIDTSSLREVLPLAGVGRRLRGLGREDMIEFLRVMPMSIQDLADDTLDSPLLKAALGAAAVRSLRQGPRSGGTTFNLLHSMVGAEDGAFRGRPWFAHAPDAFAQSAAKVAQERGVTIRTGARVEQILVADDAVAGVRLADGEEIGARTVVSTADPARTLLRMVDPVWLDPELMEAVSNIKFRGATAFVCYALDSAPHIPGAGDERALTAPVSLTSDLVALERAADAAKYGEVSADPHIDLWVPSMRWRSLAPADRHVVVARVQFAPYDLKGGTWTPEVADRLAATVTRRIAEVSPRFEDAVLHRAVLTPADLEQRFGVTEGALTHGELTLDQILFMRPVPGLGGYATPLSGLYLGGSGAHPGPGILGAAGLLAAKRASH